MNLFSGPTPSPELVRAIRHVLRPLVRLMLAGGMTYPYLAELLKGLFVEVANKDFRLDARKPTDSRITLITGVHRKDVRRLRQGETSGDAMVPSTISFGAQLVAAWLADARFLDKSGHPLPLPRTRPADGGASLEELVARRSTDIGARVVLDEWLRLGIVHLDAENRAVLNTDAFVPQTGMDEMLHFFAQNLHDHAAAATANILGIRPARLERSVSYDSLSEASIAKLEHQARLLGTKLLKELNQSAMDCEASDTGSRGPGQRFTCGVYFYSEPDSRPRTPDDPA